MGHSLEALCAKSGRRLGGRWGPARFGPARVRSKSLGTDSLAAARSLEKQRFLAAIGGLGRGSGGIVAKHSLGFGIAD